MSTMQTRFPQDSKIALANLLKKCLAESLRTDAYPTWTLQTLESADEIVAPEFTMLTVSSYDFRMYVLLHSSCDPASMRYAADALQMGAEQLSTIRHYDFLGELGNRFCGAFKRELGSCFPHTGMSTPNRLGNESLKHLRNSPCSSDTHVSARADDGTTFFASLFVSVYGTQQFRLDNLSKVEEQVEVGALELF